MPNTGHPDRALLDRWSRAITAWEAAATSWPTSQILGGGAIAAVEDLISAAHHKRPCLLLPSATYALRLALATAGVEPCDPVVVLDDPWPAGIHAARSLNATVHASCDLRTTTAPATVIVTDPEEEQDPDPVTTALARHPDAIVIEDASRLHPIDPASPVRRRSGDYVIYSLGPAKPCDAGEGGLLILPDIAAHQRALTLCAHPTRLAYERLTAHRDAFPLRVHPAAAVLAWYALTT